MPLTHTLTWRLTEHLGHWAGQPVAVNLEIPVGGGSINDCYRLDTSAGRFFVKLNSADRFPSLFEAEADGLKRIATSGALRAPEVIAFGEVDEISYLLLEYIDSGLKTDSFWAAFGRQLATLHRQSANVFGLDRDN
ncbi:MAG: fructosamine kinase family protein, partial [Flavobacteriales bacterium]